MSLTDREERLQQATQAVRSMLPAKESYTDVPQDLVAGLQKRDFKLFSALTPELVTLLGPCLLESHLLQLSLQEGQALSKATLSPSEATFTSDPVLSALIARLSAFLSSSLGPSSSGFFA